MVFGVLVLKTTLYEGEDTHTSSIARKPRHTDFDVRKRVQSFQSSSLGFTWGTSRGPHYTSHWDLLARRGLELKAPGPTPSPDSPPFGRDLEGYDSDLHIILKPSTATFTKTMVGRDFNSLYQASGSRRQTTKKR